MPIMSSEMLHVMDASRDPCATYLRNTYLPLMTVCSVPNKSTKPNRQKLNGTSPMVKHTAHNSGPIRAGEFTTWLQGCLHLTLVYTFCFWMQETWAYAFLQWQQGKCQSLAICFMCWIQPRTLEPWPERQLFATLLCAACLTTGP